MKNFFCLICCLVTVALVNSQESFTPIKEIMSKASIYNNNLIIAPRIINGPKTDSTTERQILARIINGVTATSIKQFPHQVKLFLKSATLSTEEEDVYNNCGGSIISRNWVLTAAHCLKPSLEGYVFVGCVNWSQETGTCQRIEVATENYIIHEEYVNSNTDTQNDIGLINLPQSLEFSDSVKPIPLNTNPNIAAGQSVVLSGYGVTETGNLSEELRYTTVKIISNSECQKTFPTAGESMICFGSNGKTSDCQGDSGGPMMISVNGTVSLIGVTSYGGPTCIDYPGVFTRVSYYLDWISFNAVIPEDTQGIEDIQDTEDTLDY